MAQSAATISYQQVIAMALENNYDIKIAKNTAQQAAAQNTIGNAGMLPKLDLNATGNLANNNTNQKFSSGLEVNQNGVNSNTLNAGAYLSWTIFDGLKMFATKERLNLLAMQGELGFKMQIENTIEEVTLLYYQIVKQEQLIKGIFAAMAVSEERIKIADKKKALGSGSNVEVLQAKLDLNAQKSNLITQQYLLNDFKSQLIVLTKSEMSNNYSVDTFFSFEKQNNITTIQEKVAQSNSSIIFAQRNSLIASQSIKELQAQRFPTIGLTSNYLFARSQNSAGFALLNQNLGLNTGFTFSWNLFNGLRTNSQIKVAKMQQLNTSLELERNRLNQQSVAQVAYTRWLGDKEILTLEEENIILAEQSLQITTERLKLGLGNYLETKESQSSYEAAITRLVNARYNLKQSETTLKKLT
ncbi:MAG: TolC family protein, partial [Chitinophagaceae bacterium]|nr:TolC family protein [Chitinophagaceae bacterium]